MTVHRRMMKGVLEFSRNLAVSDIAVSDIYEVIKNTEPITPISTYKSPSNLRRHYERVSHSPEGFTVVDDAMCSFNPVYGQGTNVSAIRTDVLDECLREGTLKPQGSLDRLPRCYFRKVSKVIDLLQRLATGEDFRHPQTEGKRPVGSRFLN